MKIRKMFVCYWTLVKIKATKKVTYFFVVEAFKRNHFRVSFIIRFLKIGCLAFGYFRDGFCVLLSETKYNA